MDVTTRDSEPAEIEITPEMVEAGKVALLTWLPWEVFDERAIDPGFVAKSMIERVLQGDSDRLRILEETVQQEISQRVRYDHDFEHRISYLEKNCL